MLSLISLSQPFTDFIAQQDFDPQAIDLLFDSCSLLSLQGRAIYWTEVRSIRLLLGYNCDSTKFLQFSQLSAEDKIKELKTEIQALLLKEIATIEPSLETEQLLHFLLADLQKERLIIHLYITQNFSQKAYFLYEDSSREVLKGVITGSHQGLTPPVCSEQDLVLQISDPTTCSMIKDQFNSLWEQSLDITYLTLDLLFQKTYINSKITPYQIYLKCLYEYFKESLTLDESQFQDYRPEGFIDLYYHHQAVTSAKHILQQHQGVFLADVVGLGKTTISALLAQKLQGRVLIICSSNFINYWDNTFSYFRVGGYAIESVSQLDRLLQKGVSQYDYILIDEPYRFCYPNSTSYDKLQLICQGKKIILVSATPFNNSLDNIYNQIRLFQNPLNSTLPTIPNLEQFFHNLKKYLSQYQNNDLAYLNANKEITQVVKNRILKFIMIRRTRSELLNYCAEDLKHRGLSFPEVEKPKPMLYLIDSKSEWILSQILQLVQKYSFTRYIPLSYYKSSTSEVQQQAQQNIGQFIKSLLVKHLESSFYGFQGYVRRLIDIHQNFLNLYQSGEIFMGKTLNVYDCIDTDEEAELLQTVEEDHTYRYEANQFYDQLLSAVQEDLYILRKIQYLGLKLDHDPKIEKLVLELQQNPLLVNQRIIIFTESKATGEYLYGVLNKIFLNQIFFYSSTGGLYEKREINAGISRQIIQQNFDANYLHPEYRIRILITTDVLEESVNLNRANVLINYDLPWNPNKVLQRLGRINQVGTLHPKIYVFNLLPVTGGQQNIPIDSRVKAQIQSYFDCLGESAKFLSDTIALPYLFGDQLYRQLHNQSVYQEATDDERSELEYLQILREIRVRDTQLFTLISQLPLQARTTRLVSHSQKDQLIMMLKQGELFKFVTSDEDHCKELTFFEVIDLLRCHRTTVSPPLQLRDYYELLEQGRSIFSATFTQVILSTYLTSVE